MSFHGFRFNQPHDRPQTIAALGAMAPRSIGWLRSSRRSSLSGWSCWGFLREFEGRLVEKAAYQRTRTEGFETSAIGWALLCWIGNSVAWGSCTWAGCSCASGLWSVSFAAEGIGGSCAVGYKLFIAARCWVVQGWLVFAWWRGSWWKVVQTQRGQTAGSTEPLRRNVQVVHTKQNSWVPVLFGSWASNSGCHLSPGTTLWGLGWKGRTAHSFRTVVFKKFCHCHVGSFNLPRTTPATRCPCITGSAAFVAGTLRGSSPFGAFLDATQAAAGGAESCLCTSWGWRKQSPKRGFLAWAQSSGPACASPATRHTKATKCTTTSTTTVRLENLWQFKLTTGMLDQHDQALKKGIVDALE